MSDHEIQTIVWDEFDESSHHAVPHQGGSSVNEAVALGDFLKKPQYEVGNDSGKSTSSIGYAGLALVENEETNRENDLLYHYLPDIGNFEDIDRLLSTLGTEYMERGWKGYLEEFLGQDQGNLSSVFLAQENFPKQNHFWGSDSSSYMHTFSPHARLEGSLTLHQDLFTQTTSSILYGNEYNSSSSYKIPAHVGNYFPQCMENLPVPLSEPPAMTSEEIDEKPCLGQNLCSSLTVKHLTHLDPLTSITSCQEQHHRFQQETRGDSVQKDKSLKFPATDIDSSAVKKALT
ncbi:hypothetical protein COCNU_13G002940 [Cocos nucifera]|uniref:Uncharacterized protein n=1 Tax=Cocos nucifera TaxID=13894 RepID=A0A8K0IU85_COCNU|nr:hypothetical protein COCNU_13G002940 [Cocos nucifera]